MFEIIPEDLPVGRRPIRLQVEHVEQSKELFEVFAGRAVGAVRSDECGDSPMSPDVRRAWKRGSDERVLEEALVLRSDLVFGSDPAVGPEFSDLV